MRVKTLESRARAAEDTRSQHVTHVGKEIWHLEAIRRAVIFDVDFVINGGQDAHLCADQL